MSKDKWVRRFSVDSTSRHKNGFTIYKITSILFPIESPETITVISVWKRFSDIQKLHASMKALHAGLHLRGRFPVLPKFNYFKRFQQEVIEERAKAIKSILEFIAEHKLLFTSTDFVNFLQTGYPEPENSSNGVINSIRSSLHLPIEETPPLEYQTSDDDSRSPLHSARAPPPSVDVSDLSRIPVYSSTDVERRQSPLSRSNSLQSLSSLDSIDSDLYSQLDKVQIQKTSPLVKKNVLPDLIIFDAPSTSNFEDYHTMRTDDNRSISSTNQNSEYSASITSTNQNSEYSASITSTYQNSAFNTSIASTNLNSEFNTSISSTYQNSEEYNTSISNRSDNKEYARSNSRVSCKSVLSLSNLASVECKTKTEDSYVFEAGYMLNLAARYEDMKEYSRAFECYKGGIEKMLIGVQTDTDHQRRALIKEKTNKYLSYAEDIYRNHLYDAEQRLLPESSPPRLHCPIPLSMLRRPYEDLVSYRVLAVLGARMMLVLHRGEQACYAMKVIKKIPNNLTEFDEYFLQNTIETRQPILPTVIPYMVPLHAYIETNNLIFLILSYAPGEKLFDYIKNYTKSIPNTPAREVNLENVFNEPKTKKVDTDDTSDDKGKKDDDGNSVTQMDDVPEIKIKKLDKDVAEIKIKTLDVQNENLNIDSIIEIKTELNKESEISIIDRLEMNDASNNNKTENTDMDITELVKNSQNLLKNVDKVLSEGSFKVDKSDKMEETVKMEDVKIEVTSENQNAVRSSEKMEQRVETPRSNRRAPLGCGLPPSTLAAWGAQILTAIESLHNTGVVCRDLNPSNILLGDGGQVILTYFVSYPGVEMALSTLHNYRTEPNLYIAPELYRYTYLEERDEFLERVCDFWSFGAIMYELLCGVPLSHLHRTVFTSHTLLQTPEGLPLEAKSLLTQLLTYEPSERLGGGKDGVEEIKRHPYFKHIDWTQVYQSWSVPD